MGKRKYSLPFLHNPMDEVTMEQQPELPFTDEQVLVAIDQTLREVSSILKGRYPNAKSTS